MEKTHNNPEMGMCMCIYIYNVHMALINPPAIKYANSRFTIIKPPRNKVRQLFFSVFSLEYSFSIRQFIWEYIGVFFLEGKFPYVFVFN